MVDKKYSDEGYIVNNIYPLIKLKEIDKDIAYWVRILNDKLNKQLHKRALEEIQALDKERHPLYLKHCHYRH